MGDSGWTTHWGGGLSANVIGVITVKGTRTIDIHRLEVPPPQRRIDIRHMGATIIRIPTIMIDNTMISNGEPEPTNTEIGPNPRMIDTIHEETMMITTSHEDDEWMAINFEWYVEETFKRLIANILSEPHIMFTNTPLSRQSCMSFDAQPSMYDPTLVYMAILLIGGMVCHRFGVNPFQILMMLNLLRRGGGARFGYGAYQGFGRGFGFGRQRYGFGRRGRGGYY